MRLPAAAIALFTAALHGQVLVSMDLMSGKGTAPQVGRGVGAYTWNIHVVALGTAPVPFTLVRMNFPEVRLYSKEQQDDILKQRIEDSAPKRILKIAGYAAAAGGLGIQVENTLNRSPSQMGPAIALSGLALPVIVNLAASAAPKYGIANPCPDVIALSVGTSLDCTALANFGKAPETVGPRRIDPVAGDPLKK